MERFLGDGIETINNNVFVFKSGKLLTQIGVFDVFDEFLEHFPEIFRVTLNQKCLSHV